MKVPLKFTYDASFKHNTESSQTDGQTDRQTDTPITIAHSTGGLKTHRISVNLIGPAGRCRCPNPRLAPLLYDRPHVRVWGSRLRDATSGVILR